MRKTRVNGLTGGGVIRVTYPTLRPMTTALLYIGIVAATAAVMEFVAWFAHKYVMHGWLWSWHADHHKPHFEKEGFFERNDLFFLVFAVPSALSYMIGSMYELAWLFCIGIGISVYGLIYFLIHDVFIHRRFTWFDGLNLAYTRAIVRAHGAHHAVTTKDSGESFGLLVVDRRFFGRNAEPAGSPAGGRASA